MQDKPPFAVTGPDSEFGDPAESIALPDSGWGLLNHLRDVEARAIRRARAHLHPSRTLDRMLIENAWLDDAELDTRPGGPVH